MARIKENLDLSHPLVTISSGPNVEIVDFKGEGIGMRVMKHSDMTLFAGYAENEKFSRLMTLSQMRVKLLIDAVNNRTRERNYYILYSRLCEGEITEEEFDRLLEADSDKYVISTDIHPSIEEFEEAYKLSSHIMDADTIGTIETLFSFDEEATLDVCKKISDEVL